HSMESRLLSEVTQRISGVLDQKISHVSSEIDSKLKETLAALREQRDSLVEQQVEKQIEGINTLICKIQSETGSISSGVDSIKARMEELGSSDKSCISLMQKNVQSIGASERGSGITAIGTSAPLQLLPPLPCVPAIDQNALQPSSIALGTNNNINSSTGDSGLAGALCIMVWNCVEGQRTSCGSTFTIAEAMKRVDGQKPFTLVDGWPTAAAAEVTS
ncbi:hypothetical protein LPJ75_005760, partial [Coemansia sp. RSA 2598]